MQIDWAFDSRRNRNALKKTERAIANLNEFLKSRHSSSVLQFITSTMIGWTHCDKKKRPSKSDIDLAWHSYLTLLRNSIDRRLSFASPPLHSNARMEQERLSSPPIVYEGENK